jgi:myo-inositol-1(or 4)-monophosphatase
MDPTADISATVDIESIIAIARQAGDLVVRMQDQGLSDIQSKSNDIDLVTEADLASEKLIRDELTGRYPDFGFWGEESNTPPTTALYWIVDPIDGTVNYANGIPLYAVNIALQHDANALLAVTVELPAGRAYWAELGRGAYVREANGSESRLVVNRVDRLRMAIISTGFPYDRAENPDNNSREFAYFMPRCQGVRRMGAAAIDLAYVAAGIFSGHWENGLNPWDISPGALLVQEAGGLVTDYQGNPWTPTSRAFVASNGHPDLHQALLDGIRSVRAAS